MLTLIILGCTIILGQLKTIYKTELAAHAITGIHNWNVQSTEIIKMLNWMSVRERYEYLSRVLMHKCILKPLHHI